MEDYPKTLIEFEQRFSAEEACREYIYQMRWPDGFICPRCSHQKCWKRQNGLYRCSQCKYHLSVTAGTIFQDSRIPLRLWFRAIWQVVSQKHGISALGLQRVLGLSRYETTWNMLHRLRTAMVRPGRDRLVGPVQVDEIYIGGPRPGKRGRGAAGKTLVMVAVEDNDKRAGRIRLHKVKDASGASLIPAIKESVQPKSEIRSDGWAGYSQLSTSDYTHMIIRETADVGENLLPLVNRVTALLKRWLVGTHQGKPSASHLDYYLDEFVFRFNRRTSRSRGLLFYRLVQQAVHIAPVMDQHIRGGRH
ncbi:MAG: IS1595 family transposase [Ketobacter sp.]|nr:IS1595 family transposase [Ketobacter sp.]